MVVLSIASCMCGDKQHANPKTSTLFAKYRIHITGLGDCYWKSGDFAMGRAIQKSEFHFREGRSCFSSPQRKDRLWSPQSLLYNGFQGLISPGGTAAVGKNTWSYTSTPS
jgi:hypothetical protein